MNETPCPACDGEGSPLGVLGTLLHLRCRHCGMQWSETAPPVEVEPSDPFDDVNWVGHPCHY